MAAKKKAAKKKTIRRTTLRSSKGTKLYAVRAADGTFKDIQTYKRAHAADLRQTSQAETTTKVAGKKAATKKKAPAKKKAAARKK